MPPPLWTALFCFFTFFHIEREFSGLHSHCIELEDQHTQRAEVRSLWESMFQVSDSSRKRKNLWRQISLIHSKTFLHLSVHPNHWIYHPDSCFSEQRVIVQPAKSNWTACSRMCRGQTLPDIHESFPTPHPNWLAEPESQHRISLLHL